MESSQTRADYQEIGTMLLIAEAACLRVGDLLLLPVSSNRELRKKFQGPLEEFVRLSLATVPTGALVTYQEQLLEETSDTELHISAPAGSRLPNAVLPAALLAIISFKVIESGFEPGSSIILILLGVLAARYLLRLAGSDSRRANFSEILESEVKRRSGRDIENGNTAPLIPAI